MGSFIIRSSSAGSLVPGAVQQPCNPPQKRRARGPSSNRGLSEEKAFWCEEVIHTQRQTAVKKIVIIIIFSLSRGGRP